MEEEFLKKLDDSFSNVGTNVHWERSVGGRILWFSPIPIPSQMQINETLSNENLGGNAIVEIKRVTLSHSIVGIDQTDLREYRFSGPTFPVKDERLQKIVKVELSKYIYAKMVTWGSELLDAAFDVFVDLMESHKKENLKDIKFENAKDPLTELAELEARAGEIRIQLKMPLLTEAVDEEDREILQNPEIEAPQDQEASNPQTEDSTPVMNFDPFAVPKVAPKPPVVVPVVDPVAERAAQVASQLQDELQFDDPAAVRQFPQEPPPPMPVPLPTKSVLPYAGARRAAKDFGQSDSRIGKESSPQNPFRSTPSVTSDVVETSSYGKPPVSPPVVNPTVRHQNINPRFRPTR